jgi:outer membrane lipoprotein-sorting protein
MNQREKTRGLLVDFALGDLSPHAQADVKGHLARCPECATELKRLEALLAGTERISEFSAGPEAVEVAEQAVLAAVKNQQVKEPTSGPGISLEFMRIMTMSNRKMKLAGMAAVVMVVLGGVTFWPSGTAGNGKWWLGSPAVWGQEIIAELVNIEALVHREQIVLVGRHGHTHVSGNWSRLYKARDRVRRDKYYEDTDENTFGDNSSDSVLVNITWDIPDGDDLMSYHVSFEHECYTIRISEGGAYDRDPMTKLRSYVKELDRADRILETEVFEDRECVGFEIDRARNADDPERSVDRIWFDVETKLPVRIEKHGIAVTDSPGQTATFIDDRFEYHAQIPADMFEPVIPEDFVEAEPHEIHAAKEKQEKGEMPYADVPQGLRDDIVAALNYVQTAIYRKRHGFTRDGKWIYSARNRIYVSPHAWREDVHSKYSERDDDPANEHVERTDYFVMDKSDWGETSLDFNDKAFSLTRTTVDFDDASYRIVNHGSESHPDNPLDYVIRIASLLNEADRFWEDEEIEGIQCFGFEVSAKKYGTNPDGMLHRLWLDAETKLPVKMEFEYLHKTDGKPRRSVTDRFQWNAEIPAGTFEPRIPEGFINSQPDEIRSPGRKERQG